MTLKRTDVEWCSKLFALLEEGGVWGIPRSGLLFRKEGNQFVLYAHLPHEPPMPITVEELLEQQNAEFEIVREHFAATGIEVIRKEEEEWKNSKSSRVK